MKSYVKVLALLFMTNNVVAMHYRYTKLESGQEDLRFTTIELGPNVICEPHPHCKPFYRRLYMKDLSGGWCAWLCAPFVGHECDNCCVCCTESSCGPLSPNEGVACCWRQTERQQVEEPAIAPQTTEAEQQAQQAANTASLLLLRHLGADQLPSYEQACLRLRAMPQEEAMQQEPQKLLPQRS